MDISASLARQSARIFGPPPPKGASTLEGYTYVRRIYSRMVPFIVPVWVLLALTGATWAWVVLGVSAASLLLGLVSINPRIKRLRSVPPDG
jgi:hypothetical protein